MDALGFRAAQPGDAAMLGALHVASWREAYADLLPAAVLDGLSAEARTEMWRAVLGDPASHGGTAVFVAERGAAIVGFGACGGQRDAALQARGYDGEIGALYILRAHQRAGAGRTLMRLMARALLARGRHAAGLWVLRENAAARAFYERLGGDLLAEQVGEQAGATLTEVAYGWRDLEVLARGVGD